jgi:hypothetical protein
MVNIEKGINNKNIFLYIKMTANIPEKIERINQLIYLGFNTKRKKSSSIIGARITVVRNKNE